MKHTKKMLAAILSGIMMLSFAACSSSTPSKSPSDTSASDSTPSERGQITLRFSWWGAEPRHKATLAACEKYHELNPNVTIEGEYSSFDTYYQKLVTQFAGGTAPDIIQIDQPWITDFAAQGQFFENFNDYKEFVKLDKYDANYLAGWCMNGDRLEALPFVLNGYTLMYNEKVVNMAGIDLDSDSLWTWDKLIEEGVKFKAQYPDYVFLHTDTNTLERNVFKPYLIQTYGGQYINSDYSIPFAKENLVKAYNFLLELQNKDLIQPLNETSAFEGKIDQNPVWANGKAAIVLRWATDLIQLQNPNVEVKVARLPVMEGATDTAISTKPGQLATVYSQSKNKEEAMKFVNWMLTDEIGIKTLGDTRGIPASAEARKILSEAGILNEQMVKATEIASKFMGTPQNGLNDNNEITSISQDIISKVLFKKLTPEQAADEYLKRVGEKLQSLKNSK